MIRKMQEVINKLISDLFKKFSSGFIHKKDFKLKKKNKIRKQRSDKAGGNKKGSDYNFNKKTKIKNILKKRRQK